MTYKAFENAIVSVMATGGSTNAVLHYLAIARAVGINLSLDDFQRISDRVRYITLLWHACCPASGCNLCSCCFLGDGHKLQE